MSSVDLVVRTLLREGTTLYPYRPSALKNRYRYPFGCCFPPTWAAAHPDDACRLEAAVLLEADADAEVLVELHFLQPVADDADPHERAVIVARGTPGQLRGEPCEVAFEPLTAVATASADLVGERLWRIALSVRNVGRLPPSVARNEALPATLASTHFVVRASAGRFVSVQDPPPALAELAAGCLGPPLWPFLAGPDDTAIVCSPIIVEDHASIAPESAGDFFDSTEIDEMLTLRVLTMTDDEAREAAAASPEVSALLERCRELPPRARARQWGAITNGRRRSLAPPPALQPGDRVRLRPHVRADAMDVVLAGREATIVGSEIDFEGRRYFTVVVDGDPGADLGRAGLPGHRFFFGEDEVEPLAILVAGVGNELFGDDGFGVEVARRLRERELPPGVVVREVGIRGLDLAFALMDGWSAVIIVDAIGRGCPPGTLVVLDPDLPDAAPLRDSHGLDPVRMLAMARATGERTPTLRVVGCEPARLLGQDSGLTQGLSPAVATAIPGAIELVLSTIAGLQRAEVRTDA